MTKSARYSMWWFLLTLLPRIEATITIVETGERMSSRPARHFGDRFRVGFEYMARLQYFPENLDLCPPDHVSPMELNNTVTVPPDGLPVALLARKGDCSYITKARFAAYAVSPAHVVKYLIIYEERDYRHPHLSQRGSPIGEESLRRQDDWLERDLDLKVLYVSHKSGMELLHSAQAAGSDSIGGPRVLLDGRTWTPLTRNAMFWMALSLLLSACLCSFLLSVQVNRLNGEADDAPVNTRPRRLTMQEVEMLLPETVYGQDNNNDTMSPLVARANETEEIPIGDGLTLSDNENMITTPFLLLQHQEECSICLDEYMRGDLIRSLPCGHGFHSACIAKWLTERSSTCPLCKALLERSNDDDDDSLAASSANAAEPQDSVEDDESLTARVVVNALVDSWNRARRRNRQLWRRLRNTLSEREESDNVDLTPQQPLLEEEEEVEEERVEESLVEETTEEEEAPVETS